MADSELADFIADGVVPVAPTEVRRRLAEIMQNRATLSKLREMPLVAQRSDEWYELRRNRLTASDAAQAMDRGKFGTRQQLLEKKAFPEAFPFNCDNPALTWGVMFEPIAARSYSQRNGNINIHEFGLIPHPTLDCFGASPDGITELGIMVEFKCPFRRKIDGTIPEQYELQMQGQLAVCGLTECDYVECDLQKLWNIEEYLEMLAPDATVDHGIILDYGGNTYKYSPENLTPSKAVEWMRNEVPGKPVFWRLRNIHIKRVRFDEATWNAMVPHIQGFWKDVMDLRSKGPIKPIKPAEDGPVFSKKVKYDFIEDEDDG